MTDAPPIRRLLHLPPVACFSLTGMSTSVETL